MSDQYDRQLDPNTFTLSEKYMSVQTNDVMILLKSPIIVKICAYQGNYTQNKVCSKLYVHFFIENDIATSLDEFFFNQTHPK